jgi:hypothetical protein
MVRFCHFVYPQVAPVRAGDHRVAALDTGGKQKALVHVPGMDMGAAVSHVFLRNVACRPGGG